MAAVVFWIGVVVGCVLLALLITTLVHRPLRIWPTPGEKTWQSYTFWPLFRGLNGLCFATALIERTPYLHLPAWLRAMAFVLLAGSIGVFLYSFLKLGRDNSYGAQDGLVTAGIYQWSRNPQNAMLIVVYGCLAVASDTWPVYVLCAAMMGVYALMVLCEEPWLAEIYGAAYADYCKRVPRFFNWRRLVATAGGSQA